MTDELSEAIDHSHTALSLLLTAEAACEVFKLAAAIGGTIRQARKLIESNHEALELMQIRSERHSRGTSK
ncbi:hypothetical protein DEM27_28540 [Metarhizobium album]|uniref:Uncharacterized protein n=1 Tax=Metarhizobium album TaxID=2182425 RepID=A0A2U2DHG3_9HYPH|nr:hypothetical protein [Rhizobium album]PWE52757.1 hypothetical protein DEM27_28540 [Rhizobium album]